MDNLTMHSVEHLAATVLRNGPCGEHIVYFGPMGCQTGFYLLTRGLSPLQVKEELVRALEEIVSYDGPMPGGERKECGNYQNLSLEKGKEECARYLAVLKEKETDFQYEV
jgi:S-ribosylhomocysteine lyase